MSSGSPLVTVAIPTLIAGPMLENCMKALEQQGFRAFEVVLIDNGVSKLESVRFPVSFPVRVITPGTNVGFGAAVNLAIQAAATPFVATLNDDTAPDPDWLRKCNGTRLWACALRGSGRLGTGSWIPPEC